LVFIATDVIDVPLDTDTAGEKCCHLQAELEIHLDTVMFYWRGYVEDISIEKFSYLES
jgi:hypothetical protein